VAEESTDRGHPLDSVTSEGIVQICGVGAEAVAAIDGRIATFHEEARRPDEDAVGVTGARKADGLGHQLAPCRVHRLRTQPRLRPGHAVQAAFGVVDLAIGQLALRHVEMVIAHLATDRGVLDDEVTHDNVHRLRPETVARGHIPPAEELSAHVAHGRYRQIGDRPLQSVGGIPRHAARLSLHGDVIVARVHTRTPKTLVLAVAAQSDDTHAEILRQRSKIPGTDEH
jgi:hypothetical protein